MTTQYYSSLGINRSFTIFYIVAILLICHLTSCSEWSSQGKGTIQNSKLTEDVRLFKERYNSINISDIGVFFLQQIDSRRVFGQTPTLTLFRSLNSCYSCSFEAEEVLLKISKDYPKLLVLEAFFVENQFIFNRLSSRLSIPIIGIKIDTKYYDLQSKPFFAIINRKGKLTNLVPFISGISDLYNLLASEIQQQIPGFTDYICKDSISNGLNISE